MYWLFYRFCLQFIKFNTFGCLFLYLRMLLRKWKNLSNKIPTNCNVLPENSLREDQRNTPIRKSVNR